MSRTAKGVKESDIERYLSESEGMERDLVGELQASKRKAWGVAYAMIGLAVIALGCAAAAYNRPTPDPVVLRVDNATGAVDVVTTLAGDQVSTQEADDVYWLNRYILSRESYNYDTIQATYDTTMLLSGFEPAKEYGALYEGPAALDVALSNKAEIRVQVRSIQADAEKRTAVLRWSTQKVWTGNNIAEPVQFWLANVRYDYVVGAEMSVEDRRNNPKAFQVLSFRKDPEVLSAR